MEIVLTFLNERKLLLIYLVYSYELGTDSKMNYILLERGREFYISYEMSLTI